VWKKLLVIIFKNHFRILKLFRKFLKLFLFCKLFLYEKFFIKKSYKNENLFPNPKNLKIYFPEKEDLKTQFTG
jgi:hypothetical protein